MRLEDVRHIGVLGGGVMGGGIAQIMAGIAGYQVTIRDLTQEILDETREELIERKWGVKRAVEKGKLSFDNAMRAIENTSFTLDLADVADCDLIIEAVPEARTQAGRFRGTRRCGEGRLHLRLEYVRLRDRRARRKGE